MPFLTARWEHLVLLNYVCPAALLEPLVPAGTTLDSVGGRRARQPRRLSLLGHPAAAACRSRSTARSRR